MRGATYSHRGDYAADCTMLLARAYSAGGAINRRSMASHASALEMAARASLIRAGLLEPVPGCREAVRLTKAGQRRAAAIWEALNSWPSTARHMRRDRNRVIHRNGREGRWGMCSPHLTEYWTPQLR